MDAQGSRWRMDQSTDSRLCLQPLLEISGLRTGRSPDCMVVPTQCQASCRQRRGHGSLELRGRRPWTARAHGQRGHRKRRSRDHPAELVQIVDLRVASTRMLHGMPDKATPSSYLPTGMA